MAIKSHAREAATHPLANMSPLTSIQHSVLDSALPNLYTFPHPHEDPCIPPAAGLLQPAVRR